MLSRLVSSCLPQSVRYPGIHCTKCVLSTIVTDYLLSTCFGSHHLGTPPPPPPSPPSPTPALGVELWRCTQCDMCDTCLSLTCLWAGEGGRKAGRTGSKSCVECVKNVILSHGREGKGREQGMQGRGRPCSGQLLDFPKHQTDYSLIKCAIGVLCAGRAGGIFPISLYKTGATSCIFGTRLDRRSPSCFWL